ncbi:MAG: InlB B-repeat-containing protein [Clostridiales bacterium]|nr:InlB B-repeat-containing protein [Clostridiales bacterium]
MLNGELVEDVTAVTIDKDTTFVAKWGKKVTVTFMADGLTIRSINVIAGTSGIEAPGAPSKEGEIFRGWSKTDGGEEIDVEAEIINEDTIFYAVYKNMYRVRFFDAKGALVESEEIDPSEPTVYLPAMDPNSNYIPLGWSMSKYPNGIVPYGQVGFVMTYQPESDYQASGNVDFYATYREKNAIFYDAEGGVNYGTYNAAQDTISAPQDPKYNKDGYEFCGWTDRSSLIILEPNGDAAQYLVKEFRDGGAYNLVLKKKQFNITFMHGENTLATRPYAYGDPVGNPEGITNADKSFEYKLGATISNTYTDEGGQEHVETLTFVGWNPNITSVTANATVEAKFEKLELGENQHLVIFLDENGNTARDAAGNPIPARVVTNGESAIDPGDAQIGENDIAFLGWYTDKSAKWDFATPVTENLVLTAKVKHEYTVQYMVDGKQIAYANVSKGGKIDPVDLSGMTLVKRKFLGWREQRKTEYFDFTKPVERDMVLEAHISELHYVNYETYGTLIAPFEYVVDEGTEYTEFPTATRTGYTFKGWSLQPNTETQTEATLEQVKAALAQGDVDLYAMWEGDIVPVSVVFWRQKNKQERNNDDLDVKNYNYAETQKAYARAGETVTLDGRTLVNLHATEGTTQNYGNLPADDNGGYAYYHLAGAPDVEVKATGTVINVFYNRTVYTLRFKPGTYEVWENNRWVTKYNTMTFKETVYDDNNPYTISAELDEDISNRWPHAGASGISFSKQNFYAWKITIGRNTTTQSSKLVTMTDDACNWAKSDTPMTAVYQNVGNYYLFYVFESLKGETHHKQDNNKLWYTINETYSQLAKGTQTFGYKEIEGFTHPSGDAEKKDSFNECGFSNYPNGPTVSNVKEYNILYYKRKPHTITVNLNDANEINNETVCAHLTNTGTDYDPNTKYQPVSGENETTYQITGVKYGEKLSWFEPAVPTREGCTFAGWYTDADCNEPVNFSGTMPDDNLVMYAKWRVNPITITYYLTEEPNEKAYTSSVVYIGDKAPLVTVPMNDVRYGTFAGWYYMPYADQGNMLKKDFIPGVTTVTKDTKVYAKWETLDFTLTYDYANGFDEPWTDPNSYSLQQVVKLQDLPEGITVPEGKVFAGWKEDAPYNRTFLPGGSYTVFMNMTFTAIWESKDDANKVIYHSNFDTDQTETRYSRSSEGATVSDCMFQREDYKFAGWTENADGTGKKYAVGGRISVEEFTNKNKAVNLYAQWEPTKGTLTIQKTVNLAQPAAADTTLTFTFEVTHGNQSGKVTKHTVNVVVPKDRTSGTGSVQLLKQNGEKKIQELNTDGWHTTVNGAEGSYIELQVTGQVSPTASFVNTQKNINVLVQKVWEDDGDRDGKRPDKVWVQLRNEQGVVGEKVLNGDNYWKAAFNNLPEYDPITGQKIAYSVAELNAAGEPITSGDYNEFYTVAVTGDAATGFTVTNTHIPETTEVSVTKVWKDNDDAAGNRPSPDEYKSWVELQKTNAGSKFVEGVVPEVTVDENNRNQYIVTYRDLPKYQNHQVIAYQIVEVEHPLYAMTTQDKTITNTAKETIETLTVTKTWADDNNRDEFRPEMGKFTVTLTGGGKNYTARTWTADESGNVWTANVKNVEKFDADGNVITYDVTENFANFDEYKQDEVSKTFKATSGTALAITNTHENKKYTVTYTYEGKIPSEAGDPPTSEQYEYKDVVLVQPTPNDVPGYTFTGWTRDGEQLAGGDTFSMPAGDVELVGTWAKRTDLSYTVEYREGSVTGTELAEAKTETGKTFGETYTETAKQIDGYTVDAETKSVTMTTGENKIVFIYTKRADLSYTVNYYWNNTTTPIALSNVVPNNTFESQVTVQPGTFEGYTLVADPDADPAQTITISADENLNFVNFYYYKNVTVTADDKSKEFGEADPELTATVTGLRDGDTFTPEYELAIEGEHEMVGEYEDAIIATECEEIQNDGKYLVTFVPGTFTVTGDPVVPAKSTPVVESNYALGAQIPFTITVRNVTTDTLTNVIVTDPTATIVAADGYTVRDGAAVIATLDSGSTVSVQALHTVTEQDILDGTYGNTATVRVNDQDYNATATTTQLEEPNPHLTLTKTVTSQSVSAAGYRLGETIRYEITVTNDGNLTVSDIDVTDSLSTAEGNVIGHIETLAPNLSQTFPFEYVVTEADLAADNVHNTATATAPNPDPDGPEEVPVTPGEIDTPTLNAFWLVIHYWYNRIDGRTAAERYVGVYRYGQGYNVASPRIPGYTANLGNVVGTITADTRVDVIYTPNSYTLTIQYRYTDGTVAAESYVAPNVLYGEDYSVASPVLPGYVANMTTVAGSMPDSNLTLTVFYARNTEETFVEIDEYGVPLGLGGVVMNVGDCFE